MKKISLNVIHPLTGKTVLVETVDNIMIEEFIHKLVECCVLQEGFTYSLAIKNGEETVVCEPEKKLEDYQVSGGSILILEGWSEADAARDQAPEEKDFSAAADLEQGAFSAAAAPQPDDFMTDGDPEGPRIKINSPIGIDIDEIPHINLIKWFEQTKGTPLSDALIMLLQNYRAVLKKNQEIERRHEHEQMEMHDEREKLQNKVSEYEKKFEEKRTGTIVVAISNIIIGIGTAYLTTNPPVAFSVMGAGVVITGLGLWLSLK